jgi:hypothetical protein
MSLLIRRLQQGCITALTGLAVLAVALGPCAAQDMKPIFPKTRDLIGWERVEESWQVANNKDLTPMFDGGYQLYLDFGLQTVGAFTYKAVGAEDTITMTAMFFPKKDNARSYFSYLASNIPDDAKDVAISVTDLSYTSAGVYQMYALDERYFLSIVCSGDTQEMKDAAIVMMDNTTTKIMGWTDGLTPSFVLPRDGMRKYSYTLAVSKAAAKHLYPLLAQAKLDEKEDVAIANVDGAVYEDPYNCSLVILNCGSDEASAQKCMDAIAGSTQDKLVPQGAESDSRVFSNESTHKFWALKRHKANVLVAYDAADAESAQHLLQAAVDTLEKGIGNEGEGQD